MKGSEGERRGDKWGGSEGEEESGCEKRGLEGMWGEGRKREHRDREEKVEPG